VDTTTQLTDQLDVHWHSQLRPASTGVRSLAAAALATPCGPAEGQYAEYPLAALVLHINREVIHHGAEIACVRDFYVHSN